MPKNTMRDAMLIALREANGTKYSELGKQFDITRERVRQIFEKKKYLSEMAETGCIRGMGLSTRAVNTIMKMTGEYTPTIADFAKLVSKYGTLETFRSACIRTRDAGKKTADELVRFAIAQGLLNKSELCESNR